MINIFLMDLFLFKQRNLNWLVAQIIFLFLSKQHEYNKHKDWRQVCFYWKLYKYIERKDFEEHYSCWKWEWKRSNHLGTNKITNLENI